MDTKTEEVKVDSFAARLRAGRSLRGKTQAQLAGAVGRSTSTVAAWEAGTAFARVDDVKKIGDALGLPVAWLMGATDCFSKED